MNEYSALDLAALTSSLPSFHRRKALALQKIDAHCSSFDGYVAWSGGRDSTAVVALAHSLHPSIPVVWFDSGLEFPETREYIWGLASRFDINLTVIKSEPDALTILKESGAWDHSATLGASDLDLHAALIRTPSQKAHDLFGSGELTGLRAEESVGRRALLAKNDGSYIRHDGSRVLAPIWSWSQNDVRACLADAGIPENPVYKKLAHLGAPERAQRVGLVVDGNNPDHGRYTYLRNGWPTLWAELVAVLPRLNEWR